MDALHFDSLKFFFCALDVYFSCLRFDNILDGRELVVGSGAAVDCVGGRAGIGARTSVLLLLLLLVVNGNPGLPALSDGM